MISLNFRDTCFHVPMSTAQIVPAVLISRKHYQFRVMPFRLTFITRVFNQDNGGNMQISKVMSDSHLHLSRRLAYQETRLSHASRAKRICSGPASLLGSAGEL